MEVVGIFAKIEISPFKLVDFYETFGTDLVVDIAYCMKNRKLEEQGQESLLHNQYYHHPRNQLIIKYDPQTQILFYLYFLELRSPNEMKKVPSFGVLQKVVNFMENDKTGYIAFSSSAPNFLSDPIWVSYKLECGSCTEIIPGDIPTSDLQDINRLANVYYFNPVQKYFEQLNTRENNSEVVNLVYPDHMLDTDLLQKYHNVLDMI